MTTEFRTRSGAIQPLIRLGDVCVDKHGGFYLTDGGTTSGRQRTMTGLLYGTVEDGLQEIAYPEMPNGVALSPDGALLYVAETRTRQTWEFELAGPGKIRRARGLTTVPSGGALNIGGNGFRRTPGAGCWWPPSAPAASPSSPFPGSCWA